MKLRTKLVANVLMLLLAASVSTSFAQPYDAKLFAGMHWRAIGPFRGGRTRAAKTRHNAAKKRVLLNLSTKPPLNI
jgi:hypothetical protein